jgi:predicted nucleic acid-binding protein
MVAKNSIYWDTSIFYALIKGEDHQNGELDYIKNQATMFDKGTFTIYTSCITISEVLLGHFDSEIQRDKFKKFCDRSNLILLNVTKNISVLSAEIRNYYYENPVIVKNGKNLYPDCSDSIHVATAILTKNLIKDPEFKLLTLDSNHKQKHQESSLTGLSIHGKIADKYELEIIRPSQALNEGGLFNSAS